MDENHSRVSRAQAAVPRERFLPAALRSQAVQDRALPIDCGQTISQPSLVCLMTEQLMLTPASRVLEIGTGSGYQTAILAELAEEVFSVERIRALSETAAERLAALGYRSVRLRIGDGTEGWPEAAPFDAIIVTAAAPSISLAWLKQLRPGGRLVVPVGQPPCEQRLIRVEKTPDGLPVETDLGGVWFVPLLHGTT